MVRTMALVLGFLSALAAPAWSQEDPIPPGIRAGHDAYQEFEGQRRAAAGAQIELNQILRNRLPWSSPYGDTIYYAPPAYGYGSGYSSYGYGVTMHRPYGYSPQNYLGLTAAFGPGAYIPYPSLFAYSYVAPPIRQPIGMRQVQTGPRRWESYPVYGDEPVPEAAPPVIRRAPARAAEPVREPEPPPAPMKEKPRRGPREF
jgi:hypothetical protein